MRALACALFCLAWALPGAVASIQDRGTTAPGSPAAAGAAPAPAPAGAHPPHSQAEREAGLRQLFQAIDANADGQLDALETASYASAALDLREEGWSPDAAARHSQEALDSADAGATVSKAEDHRVVEWVRHGLNLPQHAAAFQANSITALDFPLLVADAQLLAEDLGVASKLHQQQILRGLKRLILGLGELPSPPRQLECAPANKTTLRLSWAAPQAAGHPAFHKYVLSRQRVTPGTGSSRAAAASPLGGSCAADGAEERWEEVATPDDEDSMWFDAPPAKGSYRYRLTAWSAYGHSAHAHTPVACAVRAVQRQPPPPLAPAEVEAILSAAAAASNLSVGQAGAAAGAAWTWSAASSAVVVGLTILLKASQLRVGAKLAALWRAGVAAVAGTAGVAAPPGEQQQQEGGPLATGSSGMRRVGSSHASLAGLAGEAGGSAEAHMLPLPSGASTLLHSHSSSQLLFAGGSGVQGEGPGCDDTAAGEAGLLEEDALEDADAERLAQAIQRGHHCGHPGCHRRFDRLRDMRRKLESHYCGLCQRMFCLQHTRVSPHGPRGGCGLESKCVCYACFAELAPQQQAAYERSNRLPRPGAGAAANGSAAVAAGAAAAAGGLGAEQASPAAAAEVEPAEAPSQEEQRAQAAASGDAARRRWRKAGGVLRALARFRAAGAH